MSTLYSIIKKVVDAELKIEATSVICSIAMS